MKKFMYLLVAVITVQASGLIAQDNPKKMMRKASRSLSSYYIDQNRNAEELPEAQNLIDQAVQSEELNKSAKAWLKRGEIYNAIASKNVKLLSLGKGTLSEENPAVTAYNSFMKAYKYAEKNYRREDIYKGLKETASHLSNYGNIYIGKPDYEGAYSSFNAVLKISDLLTSEEEGKLFEKKADLNSQKFVVAASATQIGKKKRAKELLMELSKSEYDEPRVYSYLFKILVKENPEKAEEVMAEGKAKYPGNVDLLFAEINYLLKNDEYKKLEGKLQQAIEKDPENPSVRSALGNVYMNLFNESIAAGKKDTADIYFNKAIDYFNQTLELDSSDFNAVYSIGMMYFNKGASLTKQMQDLSIDEQKKYEKLDKRVNELFMQALPYFKRAEMMNPNDQNTLIGLQEILARMNKLETSQKIRKRLEAVQAGNTFEESFFGNN